MEMVSIDENSCTLCGLCVNVCVRRILQEEAGSIRVTDPSMCILCGHCKAVCPEDAPRLPTLNESEFQPIPPRESMPGPKELMALFRARRTIRLYTEEPVSREHLELILEAGRFAPSGGNRQPLQYIVVQTPERIRTIRRLAIDALLKMAREMEEALSRQEASGQPLPPSHQSLRVYIQVWKDLHELEKQGIDRLFYRAPALVVCHADTTDAPTPEVDAGIAAMQMVLMAETLGLGSCFCGFLVFAIKSSGQLLEALEIPKHHIVPFSFVVGHPDVEYLRTVARRPLRVRWM